MNRIRQTTSQDTSIIISLHFLGKVSVQVDPTFTNLKVYLELIAGVETYGNNEANQLLERVTVVFPEWLQGSLPNSRPQHHHGRSEITAASFDRQRL